MPDLLTWLDQRMQATLQIAQSVLPRLQSFFQSSRLETPKDLEILSNGMYYSDGKPELDVFWFEVVENEGGRTYHEFRAVRLLHLVGIPYNVRHDQGSLAKMRTILRGLYNAKVDIAYLVAGIYHPIRLGIVQCYGAAARAQTLDDAIQRARNGAASLEAALTAAYPQARLAPLTAETAEWINVSLLEMPYGILTVGHPDPREVARAQHSDLSPMLAGGKRQGQQDFTLQQNELVMRGMAQIEEDFLLQVILTPVSMQDAAHMLAGLAEYTSTWAAWQAGNRSFNLGTSLHLMLSGAIARNAGTGFTQSNSASQADGVSQVESQSHTDGQAYSHTEGAAVTNAVSNTRTVGQAHTDSQSESNSSTSGRSESATSGSGWTVSGALSFIPAIATISTSRQTFESASSGSFSALWD